MIRWIVATSLAYRNLVLALAALLFVFGVALLKKMPVDVFPEFEPPHIEIQTEALGLSADEVESLVTLNVEEFLAGTPWLETIRSESIQGLSSILLVFKPGTDIMRARQLVQENLSRAYTLPNVSKPPVMLQPTSATRRAMMVGLSSKEVSPIQTSVIAQWTIKPRLMAVPGVSNVVIWGQRNRQLQVQIDPKRLQVHNLTQEQIIRTAGDALWVSPLSYLDASIPGTGGWIDTPNQRLGIRHVQPISNPEDLADLPVSGTDNLRLGEVANVVEGHPPMIGDAFLDKGSGLILVVEKFPWANTLEVTRGVEDALKHLKAGLPGIDIDTNVFRLANYIDMAIDNLKMALIVSAILVILVLGLFLYDWRSALISVISIPLSLIAGIIVLYYYGSSINVMVLTGFGIAIGAVVDDSIIDVENIIRRLRQSGNSRSLFSTILEASLEVRGPIVYATLIIILAVIPIFFLPGVSGAFFKPLALSYTLALLASMVVALTVTPALSMILLGNAPQTQEAGFLTWVRDSYNKGLTRIIDSPKPAYLAALGMVLLSLIAWPFLGESFLPVFKERELLIEVDGTAGISHAEMTRIMSRIREEIKAIPGIYSVGGNTGRAITGDQIVGINSTQIWASIDPKADYNKTVEAVKQVVSGFEGLDRDVQTYLRERIRNVLSGENEELVIRLFGPKRDELIKLANQVKNSIADIKGLKNLQVEGQVDEPHIEVKVDIAKAAPLGLKPGDVRRAAATIFAGLEAGTLFEDQKIFEVVVWGTPQARNSISSMKDLLIDKPGGGYVRLGDVADVNIVSGPTVINHEAISPRIDILANVEGSDLGSVVDEVKTRLSQINFPMEYHPEIKGEYAESQRAKQVLFWVTIAAVIGIYFLLQASFNSFKLATLAFLALPIAIIGGIIATILNGSIVSLGSWVGFLAVLGIAARNGILLISHYQHLEHNEGVPFGPGLVIRGAIERVGPILMTAITTFVALFPFVIFGEIAGLEIEHPMAVVIMGGLITSTLLNLLLIPPLYLAFGSGTKPSVNEAA